MPNKYSFETITKLTEIIWDVIQQGDKLEESYAYGKVINMIDEEERDVMKQGFAWQELASMGVVLIVHLSLLWRYAWFLPFGPNGEDWIVQMISLGTVALVLGGGLLGVCIVHKLYSDEEEGERTNSKKKGRKKYRSDDREPLKKKMYGQPEYVEE